MNAVTAIVDADECHNIFYGPKCNNKSVVNTIMSIDYHVAQCRSTRGISTLNPTSPDSTGCGEGASCEWCQLVTWCCSITCFNNIFPLLISKTFLLHLRHRPSEVFRNSHYLFSQIRCHLEIPMNNINRSVLQGNLALPR